MEKFLQKWINHQFQYGEENIFNNFSNEFKRALNKKLKEDNFSLEVYNKGYFYVSGFIKNNETGKLCYFSTTDARDNDFMDKILVRTVESTKDYTGGSNNYTEWDNIHNLVNQLTT